MSIAVGSHLGAYEITASLGEGGMGRVFRAHDTRLNRDVAIKVLLDPVAFDEDRTARFRREAEALAALNDPHIAGIYDVFDSEGSQCLVLELVDGPTLAERIARGALPITEAVSIARQIATALEAAHDHGIIHRDLKPANIKVTADGRVKILDFGLAKGLEAVMGAASLTHSPTFIGAATRAGVILGTAAYMSPEQARGVAVGVQADIWAFGCVLFEMLAGVPPFSGPTVTDILAAVVRGEPDWAALPAETPANVRAVLRRCLQKDVSRRMHHVADVRIELEEPAVEIATAASPVGTRTRTGLLVAASGVIVVAAGVLAGVWRPNAPVAPEMRVDIATPSSQDPLSIALSPDGTKIVYMASADGVSKLWMRSLTDGGTRPLPGTELGGRPFWSADNRSIGFFADGKLKRIDLAGGLVQTIATAPIGGGGSWNRDGVIVYSPTILGGLSRIPASGGTPVAVTRVSPRQSGHANVEFLPDGQRFIYTATGTSDVRGLHLGSLDGSISTRLTEAEVSGAKAVGNDVLYVRQGTLFAQRLDARGALTGDPMAIVNGVAFDPSTSQMAALSVSSAGSIAYRVGGVTGQRQLTWFDRAGRKIGTVGAPDAAVMLNPDLSPDGRTVAVNRTVDNMDIWLLDVARGIVRRFSFDPDTDQLPSWSADGKRVIFSSSRDGGVFNLYEKAADRPGSEQLLLKTSENKFAMGSSTDGRYLLYRNTGPNTNWDLWALPLSGDRKPIAVATTPFQEMIGEFSPDGRWVAYQSNESGQFEVYVQSFPEPATRVQISTAGGSQPRWRHDGRELFYIGLDGQLMMTPMSVNASQLVEAGAPVALFPARTALGVVPSPQKQQYAVSADGQRFLLNIVTDESSAAPITLVLNWHPPGTK